MVPYIGMYDKQFNQISVICLNIVKQLNISISKKSI